MPVEVAIVLHNRKDQSKKQLQLTVLPDDTVKSLESRLASVVGIDSADLRFVLCGRVLEDDTSIRDLLLGPSTCLVALVVEHDVRLPSTSSTPSNELPPSATPQIGSFYVWCKECNDIARGKLRVYCSRGEQSAVVVREEPKGWNDVLKSNRIRVNCEDCQSEDAFAEFRFKCTTCSEVCAALCQIRGNWEQSSCCICVEESDPFMFDLGCNHPTCRSCFKEYAEVCLRDSRFVFRPPYGYTLLCPYTNCDYCVKDVHHLYVLGTDQYRKYQAVATEKLIALDDQGVFCPYSDCGASFFWETENDDGQTSCPECLRLFCRICKSRECVCQSEDDANQTLIQATTRKCPKCGVDTERNGGCAHMHCTSCGLDWCFRCIRPWTEECQWDHWFG